MCVFQCVCTGKRLKTKKKNIPTQAFLDVEAPTVRSKYDPWTHLRQAAAPAPGGSDVWKVCCPQPVYKTLATQHLIMRCAGARERGGSQRQGRARPAERPAGVGPPSRGPCLGPPACRSGPAGPRGCELCTCVLLEPAHECVHRWCVEPVSWTGSSGAPSGGGSLGPGWCRASSRPTHCGVQI